MSLNAHAHTLYKSHAFIHTPYMHMTSKITHALDIQSSRKALSLHKHVFEFYGKFAILI